MIKRQFHQFYTKVCFLISLFDENFDENKYAKHNDAKNDCTVFRYCHCISMYFQRFHFLNRTNSYPSGYKSLKTDPYGGRIRSLK